MKFAACVLALVTVGSRQAPTVPNFSVRDFQMIGPTYNTGDGTLMVTTPAFQSRDVLVWLSYRSTDATTGQTGKRQTTTVQIRQGTGHIFVGCAELSHACRIEFLDVSFVELKPGQLIAQ